jgi:AbiV family abortive infection protein
MGAQPIIPTVDQLADLARASLDNATRLLRDAEILLNAGRFPSALALAVLASEEFGKSVMAVSAVARDASNTEFWRRFWRRTRHHPTKAEIAGSIAGDFIEEEDEWVEFQERVPRFVEVGQVAKFAALYVDMDESGEIQSPDLAISEEAARVAVEALGAQIRYWDEFYRHADFRTLFRDVQPLLLRVAEAFDSDDFERAEQVFDDWHRQLRERRGR